MHTFRSVPGSPVTLTPPPLNALFVAADVHRSTPIVVVDPDDVTFNAIAEVASDNPAARVTVVVTNPVTRQRRQTGHPHLVAGNGDDVDVDPTATTVVWFTEETIDPESRWLNARRVVLVGSARWTQTPEGEPLRRRLNRRFHSAVAAEGHTQMLVFGSTLCVPRVFTHPDPNPNWDTLNGLIVVEPRTGHKDPAHRAVTGGWETAVCPRFITGHERWAAATPETLVTIDRVKRNGRAVYGGLFNHPGDTVAVTPHLDPVWVTRDPDIVGDRSRLIRYVDGSGFDQWVINTRDAHGVPIPLADMTNDMRVWLHANMDRIVTGPADPDIAWWGTPLPVEAGQFARWAATPKLVQRRFAETVAPFIMDDGWPSPEFTYATHSRVDLNLIAACLTTGPASETFKAHAARGSRHGRRVREFAPEVFEHVYVPRVLTAEQEPVRLFKQGRFDELERFMQVAF